MGDAVEIVRMPSAVSVGASLAPWEGISRENTAVLRGEADPVLIEGSDEDSPLVEVDVDIPLEEEAERAMKEQLMGCAIPKAKKMIKVLTVNGAVSRGSYDCLATATAGLKGVRLMEAPNMLKIEEKTSVPGKVVWAITSDEIALLSPKLKKSQWLARIPGLAAVMRKAPFAEALARWSEHTGRDVPFWPKTWVMPEDASELRKHMEKTKEKMTIIYKPSDGSQGDGIYLMRTVRDLDMRLGYAKSDGCAVAQEYVEDACLLNGFKFDTRLYVLVTDLGYGSAEAFLCDEGLVRVCTTAYEKPTTRNLHKVTAHLTNYSLNKTSKDFDLQDDGVNGSKRLWSETLKQLRAEQGDEKVDAMLRRLNDAIRDSLCALACEFPDVVYSDSESSSDEEDDEKPVRPQDMTPEQRLYGSVRSTRQKTAHDAAKKAKKMKRGRHRSFQILGFDVMLTEDLQPVVLEVNGNPSMRIDQVVVSNEKIDGRKVCKCMSHHRPHCHLPCHTDTVAKKAAVAGALKVIRRMAFEKKTVDDPELLEDVPYTTVCSGDLPDDLVAPPNPESCVADFIPHLPRNGLRGARTYLKTWTGAPVRNIPKP